MRKALVATLILLVFLAWLAWGGGLRLLAGLAPRGPAGSTATSGTGTHATPTVTATPPSPPPSSLNGTLRVLDGEALTANLWSRMRDVNVSEVKPYMDWLLAALGPNPAGAMRVEWREGNETLAPEVRVFDTRVGWGQPAGWGYEPPRDVKLVRMGVVRLAFGAVLVVTAFYNGGGIDVVIHGAFANASAYLDLFERSLAIADDRYVPPGWLRNDPFYTIEHAAGEVRKAVSGWALWRVELPASDGAVLEAGSASYRINRVLLLLEEPVAKLESRMRLSDYLEEGNGTVSRITFDNAPFSWTPDLGFWVVVGHPAFALAVRLTHPPGHDLDDLYSYWVPRVTLDVILGNASGRVVGLMSPMVPRYLDGYVCGGASTSTALFASSALGAFASVFLLSPMPDPSTGLPVPHAISVLHYARYRLSIYAQAYDVDGDGAEDAITLVDTASLPKETVLEKLESVTKFYPGIGTPTMLYTGIANATLALPAWLKAPWLDAMLTRALALRPAIVPGSWMGNIVDAAPANLAMTAGNTETARVAMEQYRWVVGDPDYLAFLDSISRRFEPPSLVRGALPAALAAAPVVYEAPPAPRILVVEAEKKEDVQTGVDEHGRPVGYARYEADAGGLNITLHIGNWKNPSEWAFAVYVNGELVFEHRWRPDDQVRGREFYYYVHHGGTIYYVFVNW